ncbi:glycosyltransferase family 1 protein [Clostridium vincentii]|uniref:Putative glycosyltransferase EpsF n=1 Tax=Clostridium vincentii TaxID=52704 RepID=A0A2T0BD09_9CLOT|nr:glycosyltransferase family 1 protein [Clostridium vincentii]PRR81764.1 putative glycosyltransferase EpsF [Clostridium vincentii]
MLKIKVLQVVGQLTIGGQEMMVMNFCRFITKEEIEFDFLVYGDKVGEFEKEAKLMGGKVIHAPSLNEVGYREFKHRIKKIMEENGPYNAIHSHTSFNSGFIMKVAKEKGIPIRITHSHTTKPGKKSTVVFKLYTNFMRRWIINNSTHLLACGNEAGNYLYSEDVFKKKGIIIKNGINVKRFTPNSQVRDEMRKKFDVENKFVIGHVGRMSVEKNHIFLINIFKEIHKRDSNAVLILVGTGPLYDELKSKVIKLEIEKNVIFTGQRADIPEILQLMDIFVFPSIYEGLPVSVVEAQATGLPCIVSKNVTSEIKVTELVKFMDLKTAEKIWADVILEKRHFPRMDITEEIEKSGYGIQGICKQLENLYCKGELK